MGKTFFTEYVRHAMRFYSRTTIKPSNFKSEADKSNWLSCHSAMKGYDDTQKAILIEVYGGYDTLADEVYLSAKKHSVNQNIIWDMMKGFEKKVAKNRGLI